MKRLKTAARWLLQGLAGLIFVGFTSLMLVEWMAGCGETYIDAKGTSHQHECIFLENIR
jgi:hypothetical protein